MKVSELLQAPLDEAQPIAEAEKRITTLSDEDKDDIIEDFKMWSGGFTPDECPMEQHREYVEFAMDAKFDDEAVWDFLTDYEAD